MYDSIDGGAISPKLRGKNIDVPPPWVREKTHFSKRYQYATLSSKVDLYEKQELKDTCVSYLKSWPDVCRSGADLLLSGEDEFVLSWFAAATANEIVLRFGKSVDIQPAWLNLKKGLPLVLDYQKNNYEFYNKIRNKFIDSSLLIVDGILDIEFLQDGYWFLNQIYQHRYEECLPTITTMDSPFDSQEVADILRHNLTDRIISNAFEWSYR